MRDLLLYLNAINTNYNHIPSVLASFNHLEELLYYKGDFSNFEIPSSTKKRLSKAYSSFDLEKYKEDLWKKGVKVTYCLDENFPENLKYIPDHPYLLYYKGNLSSIFNYSMSIIGARKCTNYGQWAAESLASDLASLGIPIASGLALGIDRIAHDATLKRDEHTVAILGTGIDIEYPASNRTIYQRMHASDKSLILSEYPLGTRANRHTFPWRNRIISGIGKGLVVIEAKKKSGTLITANYALDQGKEVFAVPGNINSLYSTGTNELIRDGAKMVLGVEDILVELPELKEILAEAKEEDLSYLTHDQKRIIKSLEEYPKSIDELSFELDFEISKLLMILTELEILGLIKDMGTKFTIN